MSYVINNHTKIVIKSKKDFSETILLDTSQGETGSVEAGIPVLDVIDDSLDSFVFKIKDYPTRKPFPPFDLVEMTVNSETAQYFVLTDRVSTYSQARGTYMHTIACVETTKYLEKIKIFNLTLTNKSDALLDQFNKALINVEPLFYSGISTARSRFSLSASLEAFLTGKESRDFYFGNTDFRTVLDQMLSAHNARIVVEAVSFNSEKKVYTIELGYHPINTANDVIPQWTFEENGQIVHEEAENDGQDYAGKIVSIGYNALAENPLTIRDIPRSDEATVSDVSAALFLPLPISDRGISRLAVYATVYCYTVIVDEGEQAGERTFPIELDLTGRVLPREQYDLLSQLEQEEYFPYEIGATKIDLNAYYKKWWGKEVLKIDEWLKEEAHEKHVSLGYSKKWRLDKVDKYYDATYIVTYYPIYDAISSISKPSAQKNANQLLLGVMDSQTEKTLDVDLYGRKLSGLIKRTGNDTYCVDVKAKCYDNLLPLLSRITLPFTGEENYVLYKREYAIYDNFVNCRYYFSQNYNAVQENAGINRERHLYDIPLESEETPIVIKKYLHFSTEEASGDIAFKLAFACSALNTLIGGNRGIVVDGETVAGRLQYLLFQSGNNLSEVRETFPRNMETESEINFPYASNADARFILPLGGYALDKTMNFMAKPLDNFSVGYSRTGYIFSLWGDGGYRTLYNRYVSKRQNSIGEVRTFDLEFAFDTKYTKIPTTYPVAEITKAYNAMSNPIHLLYRKDRAQTPVFVLSVETTVAEADEKRIIVTPLFSRMNNLVRDNVGDLKNLKLYLSNSYTIEEEDEFLSADYIKNGVEYNVTDLFTVEETSSGAVLKYAAGGTPIVKSWCIVDDSNRIYLAVNDTLKNIYACVSDNP